MASRSDKQSQEMATLIDMFSESESDMETMSEEKM